MGNALGGLLGTGAEAEVGVVVASLRPGFQIHSDWEMSKPGLRRSLRREEGASIMRPESARLAGWGPSGAQWASVLGAGHGADEAHVIPIIALTV